MASKFSITNSVLNKASLDLANTNYKISNISYSKIVANKENFYLVNDVEELKESILQQGLQQPLVVAENDDETYTIISGHRRYKALTELISEDKKEFVNVPCKIVELSENQRILALISANATSRELTDFEKVEQVKRMRETLTRLKEEGYNLSGRQRDIIATELGISSTQVQRLDYIGKNLNESFKQEMVNEKVPLTVAESISKLPAEEQEELYQETIEQKGEITQKDVDAHKQKKETKTKNYNIEKELCEAIRTIYSPKELFQFYTFSVPTTQEAIKKILKPKNGFMGGSVEFENQKSGFINMKASQAELIIGDQKEHFPVSYSDIDGCVRMMIRENRLITETEKKNLFKTMCE